MPKEVGVELGVSWLLLQPGLNELPDARQEFDGGCLYGAPIQRVYQDPKLDTRFCSNADMTREVCKVGQRSSVGQKIPPSLFDCWTAIAAKHGDTLAPIRLWVNALKFVQAYSEQTSYHVG